ncbi:hypothetical protein LSH36_1755g00003 [Paralvinella palmiformis]|uniref:Uncharacterized protein n=1 Tax=Paralvinella palmiformis TaxID=53620 RepID=A0AAD9IS08_9ANNE|nr:hypothetical protein LSH36_1755g00003 [Paralvinella palmiformis]
MDKKKSFLFTIIFLSQSAYQIWGDECDFMGPTGLYCVVNNKLYDNGNLMYAFDQSVVAVNAILPSNNRVTALATATCRRLFVDDREEYCVPKSCTVPICLFQFVDPEPAERIIIEVVSNNDQCQQVNFNFYFKGKPLISYSTNDRAFGHIEDN